MSDIISPMQAVMQTSVPGLGQPRRGKVREVYDLGSELLIVATDRISAFDVVMANGVPGKGVILIKLSSPEDRVLGFIASTGDRDLMTVETSRGAEQTISTTKYDVTGRGGKGRELLQRGQFTRVIWPTPEAPPILGE